MNRLALLVAAIALPTAVYAGGDSYTCTVDTEQEISDAGELRVMDPPVYLNKEFHVIRESGLVLGEGFLGNGGKWQRTVIHPGDPSTSFMLFSLSRAEVGAYLTIKEWVDGIRKPFVYVIGNMILTGTCA